MQMNIRDTVIAFNHHCYQTFKGQISSFLFIDDKQSRRIQHATRKILQKH